VTREKTEILGHYSKRHFRIRFCVVRKKTFCISRAKIRSALSSVSILQDSFGHTKHNLVRFRSNGKVCRNKKVKSAGIGVCVYSRFFFLVVVVV
jgi:hypothetical protein